jgi:hypothetical protein
MPCVTEDLGQRAAAARDLVRELGCVLSRDTMAVFRAAWDNCAWSASEPCAAALGENSARRP